MEYLLYLSKETEVLYTPTELIGYIITIGQNKLLAQAAYFTLAEIEYNTRVCFD